MSEKYVEIYLSVILPCMALIAFVFIQWGLYLCCQKRKECRHNIQRKQDIVTDKKKVSSQEVDVETQKIHSDEGKDATAGMKGKKSTPISPAATTDIDIERQLPHPEDSEEKPAEKASTQGEKNISVSPDVIEDGNRPITVPEDSEGKTAVKGKSLLENNSNADLKNMERPEEEIVYLCEICSWPFVDKKEGQSHMRRHRKRTTSSVRNKTGSREGKKKTECPICGKIFRGTSEFVKHTIKEHHSG